MAAPDPTAEPTAERTAEPTAAVPLQDDAGFLLAIARSVAMRKVKSALEPVGLRARTYSLLALVASGDGCTQREAATALYLEPSQVVPLVDELAGLGLVERQPHGSDRRARILAATPAGRRLVEDARARVAGAMDEVLADLSADERDQLHRLLVTVIATDRKAR